MRRDLDDLDDEIRGHLAISIKDRIENGEDPASARLAALKEFGNVTLTRDSIRGVWRHRWLDSAAALGRDIRFAMRALSRSEERRVGKEWRYRGSSEDEKKERQL